MLLRLVADDLTGALDAAAPFATEHSPVRLILPSSSVHHDTHPKLAISTESRALQEGEARRLVSEAVERLRFGSNAQTLWFKKVDSVLRGHPLAETFEMARAAGLTHCVFAPAFPEMGRITREGIHLFRNQQGDWEPTSQGDLHAAFQELLADLAPSLTVTVTDAQTTQQLRDAVLQRKDLPTTLWAGSRGLAQALGAQNAMLPAPALGLIVIGTTHPATRAQALRLTALTEPVPDQGTFSPRDTAPLLLDPVPFCTDGANTRNAIARSLQRLQPSRNGSAIFVTGGDSLTVVLDVLGVTAVECLGEIDRGLPLARIVGGRMDGTMMVTKSGGFGEPELLQKLVFRGNDAAICAGCSHP